MLPVAFHVNEMKVMRHLSVESTHWIVLDSAAEQTVLRQHVLEVYTKMYLKYILKITYI